MIGCDERRRKKNGFKELSVGQNACHVDEHRGVSIVG